MFHYLQVMPVGVRMARNACTVQVQGADAAVTSEQGTGASQPHAAPAPDLDGLANMMQGLDSRGWAVMDAHVSTHRKVALISSTTQHICIYAQTHACVIICAYICVALERMLLPKHGWAQS